MLIHSLAAIAAIIVWITHVYAGDLGQRLGAGDDAGLCDAGLGVAASSQMAAAAWRRPVPRAAAASAKRPRETGRGATQGKWTGIRPAA